MVQGSKEGMKEERERERERERGRIDVEGEGDRIDWRVQQAKVASRLFHILGTFAS